MCFLWSTALRKLGLALVIACLLVPCVNAQEPAITLVMDSISVVHPDTAYITVYLTNPADSITAFSLWIQLNRPDIARFVPVNAPGVGYDSAGTLVGGWFEISLKSFSGTDFDVRVLAVANQYGNPNHHDIGPSSLPRPLIRLALVALPLPDTSSDRVALLYWNTMQPYLSFSRPDGSSVTVSDAILIPGLVGNGCEVRGDIDGNGTGYETTDYVRLAAVLSGLPVAIAEPWQADINYDCVVDTVDLSLLDCISHGQCPEPPAPGFACCTPIVVSCCDGLRGNIDCDSTGNVDISDLTAFINNLFVSFELLCCVGEADLNGDGSVDIGDLTTLIDNLFVSFSALPPCGF